MKITQWFPVGALAATLALAGCSSPARSPGIIHLGDTPEIVETAMGRPNRKLERPATGGRETV